MTYSGKTQSHPLRIRNQNLFKIKSQNSSGAFPVSRLLIKHPLLPLIVTLRAFSEFEMHAHNNSVAPVVFFAFDFENPSGEQQLEAGLFFNLPDIIGGEFSNFAREGLRGITLNKVAATPPGWDMTQGNMSVSLLACHSRAGGACSAAFSTAAAASLQDNWAAFVNGSGVFPSPPPPHPPPFSHGAVAAKISVAPRDRVTVTLALSWFYPKRRWGALDLGHYYQNLYSSSENVAEAEGSLPRLSRTVDSIVKWQQLCFNNSLPSDLQDALVGDVSTSNAACSVN